MADKKKNQDAPKNAEAGVETEATVTPEAPAAEAAAAEAPAPEVAAAGAPVEEAGAAEAPADEAPAAQADEAEVSLNQEAARKAEEKAAKVEAKAAKADAAKGAKPAAKALLEHLSQREQVAKMVAASDGYDIPAFATLTDLDTWSTVGPPRGTVFNYPVKEHHKAEPSIACSPAPASIAALSPILLPSPR